MTNKETISKVNKELQHGDRTLIAKNTGISEFSVSRFFNGKGGAMMVDSQTKIMDAALAIIESRKKTRDRIEKKTNALID